MNHTPLEVSTDWIVLTLMDHAEQYPNLNQMKINLCELEDSIRNMVSPEAWDLIMRWDEEAAHFRFHLVKNVLTSIGISVANLQT